MGIISGKQISEAIAKARSVGLVEEPCTIGDCTIVLRNLRPDEYVAILQEVKDLDEIDYLYGFQKGHVARAICEVNGVDLRDADYVEVEEPDPKNKDRTRTIKLELHKYVRQAFLDSWGKEAVQTAFRKFGDVVKIAEDNSKKGITFIIPEENAEEKMRRLFNEIIELQEEVPSTLVARIFDEYGLMKKSTAAEIKATMERADELAREQEKVRQAAEAPTEEPPPPATPVPQPAPPPPDPVPQEPVRAPPSSIMAARRPLNQPLPPDPHQTLQHQVAHAQPAIPVREANVAKSASIAALEGDAGITHPDLPHPGAPYGAPVAQVQEVAELRTRGVEAVDIKAFHANVETPPKGGLNPRFKAPPRA